MKTNDSKQNQGAGRGENTSSVSSRKANSKMLKPDSDKEKDKKAASDSEKFEGTLRHKED